MVYPILMLPLLETNALRVHIWYPTLLSPSCLLDRVGPPVLFLMQRQVCHVCIVAPMFTSSTNKSTPMHSKWDTSGIQVGYKWDTSRKQPKMGRDTCAAANGASPPAHTGLQPEGGGMHQSAACVLSLPRCADRRKPGMGVPPPAKPSPQPHPYCWPTLPPLPIWGTSTPSHPGLLPSSPAPCAARCPHRQANSEHFGLAPLWLTLGAWQGSAGI